MADEHDDLAKIRKNLKGYHKELKRESAKRAAFLELENNYYRKKFRGRDSKPSKLTLKRLEFIRRIVGNFKTQKPAAISAFVIENHRPEVEKLWGEIDKASSKITNFVNNHRAKIQ